MPTTHSMQVKIKNSNDEPTNVDMRVDEDVTYYDPKRSLFVTPTTLVVKYDLEHRGGLLPPPDNDDVICESNNTEYASKPMLERMVREFEIIWHMADLKHRMRMFWKKLRSKLPG